MDKKEYHPFVSVAIAVFNGEKYLKYLLESLLDQTYDNFEIIISDDKSTDGTQSILDEYSRKDNRVKWSINEKPSGCSRNFERAFSLCSGEIIFVCDADDIWYKTKIEEHVREYEDESIVWVYNKSIITDEHNNITGSLEDLMPSYFVFKRNMLHNVWGSCIGGAHGSYRSRFVKKAMKNYEEILPFDAWLQLYIWPAKSKYIEKVLQDYRRHGSNESSLLSEGVKPGTVEYDNIEKAAISTNLKRLRLLSRCKSLSLLKRLFFGLVYVLKKIREKIK